MRQAATWDAFFVANNSYMYINWMLQEFKKMFDLLKRNLFTCWLVILAVLLNNVELFYVFAQFTSVHVTAVKNIEL